MPDEPNKPTRNSSIADAPLALSAHGMDTTFFMSRGRHLMHAPVQELMAICDRLVLQARALGRERMVPDFEKIAEAARHLLSELNDTEPITAPRGKLRSIIADFSPTWVEDEIKTMIGGDPVANSGASQTELSAVSAPELAIKRPRILVVEDSVKNAEIVSLLLEHQGYAVTVASDGEQAMSKVQGQSFDLVLLDILLPEMNGYQVLEAIKTDAGMKHLPVIMLSGVGDMDSVVRCIEMGADDYLPKPFNPVLLQARIEASLEKKRLRDAEFEHLKELKAEREKSEILLRNIMPQAIADRLMKGESPIVDHLPAVTVLFADLVGFIQLGMRLTPPELVDSLNEIFISFDRLAEQHGVEKIKTIGDAYMVVGGLPTQRSDHAEAVAEMALDMQEEIRQFNLAHHFDLSLRIGIHTGPVIAGIIGRNKFSYDLWGDTVNVASRMESQGQPGLIQMTIVTSELLRRDFVVEQRGIVDVKGKGEMTTFLLRGRKAEARAPVLAHAA